MEIKKPEPKYKRGQEVTCRDTTLKIGGCSWNKEYQQFQYYIHPYIAPFYESELSPKPSKMKTTKLTLTLTIDHQDINIDELKELLSTAIKEAIFTDSFTIEDVQIEEEIAPKRFY